jgi:hypothetical protein
MGKYSVFYTEIGINPTFFFMYACYYLNFKFKFINFLVNYGVVLLLCVVSLMAGSTTGVPMSSWYGGYQTETPPPYYHKATQRPVPAPRSTSTTLLRHRSFIPQLTRTRATILTPWSITLPWVTTPPRRRSRTTHAAPSCYTDAPKYYSVLSYLLHRFS